MPIYEFYCKRCHTIFNFLSRKINTQTCPGCPKCKTRKLARQVSMFAATGASEDSGDMDGLPFDERRMESALNQLASEAEHISENDPKAAADLMRKFSSMTGVEFGGSMENALKRLEAGESPDEIEKDLGPLMDGEDDAFLISKKAGVKNRCPPARDDTLYEM